MTGQSTLRDEWRACFHDQHERLAAAVEALSYRNVPTERILDDALAATGCIPFHEQFGPVFALRATVKAAIAINYEAMDSEIEMTATNPSESGSIAGLPIGSLPWPERAVYFLRKILNYSRRDTALLLGLSDANVDQLHCIAEKRIGSSRRPFIASPEIVAKLPVHARAKHSAAFSAYE